VSATSARARRSGIGFVLCGLLCGLTAFSGWRATPARAASVRPASLGAFDFHSGARGVRFFDIDAKNGNEDGDVPEASSNLASGPVGSALAAVAWPGPIAGNVGTLILVSSPSAPPQASMLNDPVKAEAHTGQNPPTVTNSSVPGVTMTATATSDTVQSDATVQNTASDAGTFGPTHAHSSTTTTGDVGKAASNSVVQNVNIGAGAVKIDSVTSTAEAHSDGTKADGSATTTVNGMTIGGTPATVDQNGVHVGDQGQPANQAANAAAQQVLAQSGITMTVSAPTRDVKGSNAAVTAGSLIITFPTGAGNPTFVMTIGGAEASVAATTADESPSLADLGTSVSGGAGGGGDVASLVDTSPSGVAAGGLGVASGVAGSGSPVVPSSGGARPTTTRVTPFTPAAAFGARPTTFGWVLLALVAAGLVSFGLRRLTDDLLGERGASACPLQQDNTP
jgi:hypothetical protein